MVRVLYLQFSALVAVTLLCALASGASGAWSAAAGGLSYFVPSLVTVLFLNIFRNMPPYAGYASDACGVRILSSEFEVSAVPLRSVGSQPSNFFCFLES